jgi:hypothetical protein
VILAGEFDGDKRGHERGVRHCRKKGAQTDQSEQDGVLECRK